MDTNEAVAVIDGAIEEIVIVRKTIKHLESENLTLKEENAELKKELEHYKTINEMTRPF